MSIFVVEPAIIEPVSLEELRLHCRIDDDYIDENGLLSTYIRAAREYCEDYTGRHFSEKTLGFSGCFPESRKPIELSPNFDDILYVEYIDSKGTNQSIAQTDLYVDHFGLHGSIQPKAAWPLTAPNHPHPVTIHFECGSGECPLAVKQSILLLAAHWYQNREGSTIGVASKEAEYSVHSLLEHLRVINV
jgi:uncharacterized phiE125 gp8 family phage protein